MDISYFRDFVTLAETRNYWAAAERLFISQSALSKRVKSMEKELGAPLFIRTTRSVELSELGLILLPYARAIAQTQTQYEAAVYNHIHFGNEILEIACIPTMSQYGIIGLLAEFQKFHPNIQIRTREADTMLVREWLIDRQCELAFYRDSSSYLEHDPDKETQLEKLPWYTDHLAAVLPAGHPLAGREALSLAELREENFALLKEETMPYDLCVRACREAGFIPRVCFTSHNLDALLDMVARGSCAALLFDHQTAPLLSRWNAGGQVVTMVDISPRIDTTIYLSWLKDHPLSPSSARFLEFLQERTGREDQVPSSPD